VTLLVAGAALIGAAGLWLVVVCWKTRTVLGGLLGATGIGPAYPQGRWSVSQST